MMSAIQVGDYVQHKTRNIKGKVTKISNGTCTLANGECGSLYYFSKESEPKESIGLLLTSLGISISLISLALNYYLSR